ncbi:hypothetical protein LTR64_007313 [Lithohypha guttulata]|uniref:uncharacterized protein n=1 Tax=Lithohypha guttulata TaxID=1690604 RepID=UPI00315DEBBB
MSYARPGFLASIVASVDKEPDSREVAAVCAVVEKRKHADLAAARQLECQKNRNLVHVAEEEDDVRVRDQDAEVVESPDNPDDLDKMGPGGMRQQFIRSIPHFARLNEKTRDLLPQYIFRVVHSESAGKVFEKDGITHFESHAVHTHGSSAFDAFTQDEITDQLRAHICGWTSTGGQPFSSHFISTTDSFECALNRAERHVVNKGTDITIYVIDTNSLQQPTVAILMFLALQAWNVSSKLPEWRNELYRYGSLTEWLFWDEIAASWVDRIEYPKFANPKRTSDNRWKLSLRDVIPDVVDAARGDENTKRGVPRTILHAALYSTQRMEEERRYFDLSVFVGRCGPLPDAPASVKRDKRANISAQHIEDVWTLASATNSKNLVFMWILSLTTQRFYFDSIVRGVVQYHPEVVVDTLHVMSGGEDAGAMKTLVYYMPGPHCFGRVDVNQYQKLMEACIVQWDLLQKVNATSSHRPAIYIATGPARPLRNLLQLKELGLLGKCRIEPILKDHGVTVGHPDLKTVETRARRVLQRETDEEFRARRRADYGDKFYPPTEKPLVTTRRVKDRGHLRRYDKKVATDYSWGFSTNQQPTSTAEAALGDKSDASQLPIKRDERKLLLAQARQPPTVGSTILSALTETKSITSEL